MSTAMIILVVVALAILTAVALVERRIRLDRAEERRRGLNRERDAPMIGDDRMKALGLAGKGCVSAAILGFGPTLAFVISFHVAPAASGERIFVATGIFMLAAVAVVLVRLIKPLPDLPRIPWRNLLIILMCSLTLWLHDDLFIKMRPTVHNVLSAALAILALLTADPGLETMFGRKRMDLDQDGWRKLVSMGAILSILMAMLNEYVWRTRSEAFWVGFQLWGPPLFFGLLLLWAFTFLRDHLPPRQCKVRAANEQ